MKRIVAVALVLVLVFSFTVSSFASDWDVAGKVLTGLEGLRILTGGKVDPIGNIAGINRQRKGSRYHHEGYVERCRKVWVPNLVWERKWIPEHREYDEKYGEIFVEGHYIKYKVERGGRWEYDCSSCRWDD